MDPPRQSAEQQLSLDNLPDGVMYVLRNAHEDGRIYAHELVWHTCIACRACNVWQALKGGCYPHV